MRPNKLAPVEKPELIQHIRYEILERYLKGSPEGCPAGRSPADYTLRVPPR